MCHNADLVLRPGELPSLPEEEVWAFLRRRAGLVDGVVISGGEPTLQPDLLPFVRRVRQMGLDVKLDTNGYNPDVLAALLEEELVEYVAMDVKGPPDRYGLLAGRPEVDLERLERSIRLLREGPARCEFRTTVVPGLLEKDDIAAIARWLEGADLYVLQQFRPLKTLDPALQEVSPYPMAVLDRMAETARQWIPRVVVRGG